MNMLIRAQNNISELIVQLKQLNDDLDIYTDFLIFCDEDEIKSNSKQIAEIKKEINEKKVDLNVYYAYCKYKLDFIDDKYIIQNITNTLKHADQVLT